jgi:hypothetical protein
MFSSEFCWGWTATYRGCTRLFWFIEEKEKAIALMHGALSG